MNQSFIQLPTWLLNPNGPWTVVPLQKIFAVFGGIEEGKQILAAYCEILNMDIKLQLCIDSEDLYN